MMNKEKLVRQLFKHRGLDIRSILETIFVPSVVCGMIGHPADRLQVMHWNDLQEDETYGPLYGGFMCGRCCGALDLPFFGNEIISIKNKNGEFEVYVPHGLPRK